MRVALTKYPALARALLPPFEPPAASVGVAHSARSKDPRAHLLIAADWFLPFGSRRPMAYTPNLRAGSLTLVAYGRLSAHSR
jgi:hypothetical protein